MKVHPKLVKCKTTDYEFLSNCIAKAILNAEQIKIKNEEQKEQQKKIERQEKKNGFSKCSFIRFFQILKYICKNPEEGNFVSFWLSMLLQMIFFALAVLFFLFSIRLVIVSIDNINVLKWNEWYLVLFSIIKISLVILLVLTSLMLSIFSFVTIKEIDNTKNKDYLSSVFAGIVSFVALIVSAIALIMG